MKILNTNKSNKIAVSIGISSFMFVIFGFLPFFDEFFKAAQAVEPSNEITIKYFKKFWGGEAIVEFSSNNNTIKVGKVPFIEYKIVNDTVDKSLLMNNIKEIGDSVENCSPAPDDIWIEINDKHYNLCPGALSFLNMKINDFIHNAYKISEYKETLVNTFLIP